MIIYAKSLKVDVDKRSLVALDQKGNVVKTFDLAPRAKIEIEDFHSVALAKAGERGEREFMEFRFPAVYACETSLEELPSRIVCRRVKI